MDGTVNGIGDTYVVSLYHGFVGFPSSIVPGELWTYLLYWFFWFGGFSGSLHDGRTPFAAGHYHPVESYRQCGFLDSLAIPGPWVKRLPHTRAEFLPSLPTLGLRRESSGISDTPCTLVLVRPALVKEPQCPAMLTY